MEDAIYLAHSKNDDGRGVAEPLAVHLTKVADRAAQYASVFGAEQEARVAGLLHDLGKYSERFLARLRGEERGLDHWTPGAVLARKHYGTNGTAVSVAILGHHIGMNHSGRSSVVFSTATQPAFDHLHKHVATLATTGWRPREVVPPALDLFARSRRTRLEWRVNEDERISWEQLASELAERPQALCVVNLKRHAAELANLLRKRRGSDVLHLSTNMCPAHRRAALDQTRDRLKRGPGTPCLLVSTQCVEAGVDVDFPMVYRALAPLDSVAQAAGRCNRNGGLGELGVVRVFVPAEDGYPAGWYSQATDATRTHLRLLEGRGISVEDLTDRRNLLREYYQQLYDLGNVGAMEDRRGRALRDALDRRSFVDVAHEYRLIPQDTIEVLVPFEPEAYWQLRNEVEHYGRLTRQWILRAREHAVGIFRPRPEDHSGVWNMLQPVPQRGRQAIEGRVAEWFVLVGRDLGELYDDLLGLRQLGGHWIA